MAMRILVKMLVQTAVYWGNPSSDGRGGQQYDAPVEISARWEDVEQAFVDDTGQERLSKALVYVSQDVEVGGVLWLGELATLVTNKRTEPKDLVGEAFEIRKAGKIPTLKGDQYLRTAYL